MARRYSTVYFIQAADGFPIKIGVSINLMRRLTDLRHASGLHLKVLGVIRDGTRETEQALHRRFNEGRLVGEWFRPDPDLLEYIREQASPWDESEHFGRGRHLAFVPPPDGLNPSRLVAPQKRVTDEGGKRSIQDEAMRLMDEAGYERWRIAIITGLSEDEVADRLRAMSYWKVARISLGIEPE
jgi:hypothetical protein